MQVRLARCGMRSVSLAVDVTNYLMLELGQPLHAFDRAKLHGPIVVRRARPGETLTTLDHVDRTLHDDDILITDDSGPISLAGTMGGLATEIDDDSTDIVIEGAHFSDTGTAKMARRHRLHSEASYRFERGTDRELPLRATGRAAALLASLGGATVVPGATHAQVPVTPVTIQLAADYPDRVAGVVYGMDTVVARLQEVGCEVRSTPSSQVPTIAPWRAGQRRGGGRRRRPRRATPEHGKHDRQHMILLVTPPSWRPDLTDAGRPGRGGHPPRGLQQPPGPAAARPGRPGPDPAAEVAAGGRPHARRRGLRRGALRPVRPGDGGGQPDARAGGPAPPRGQGRQPAERGPAAAAHHPAARAVPHPGAEHRPGLPRHRPVRDRPGVPAGPGRAGHRADPRHRPRPHRGGARGARRRPARPAGAGGGRAVRAARAARLVGTGARRELGRRDRGGPVGRRRVPPVLRRAGGGRGAVAPRPVRRPARARSPGATASGTSGSPATRASCTRG